MNRQWDYCMRKVSIFIGLDTRKCLSWTPIKHLGILGGFIDINGACSTFNI
ncbi:unnamed protein product [Meloidogyne enterolobii]|uniref:Uncharacterized protein n=1 Tax=Meloidogyne enterolobii TaxID=390850 RepID=A0ACB0Y5C1_MELEN